MEWFEEFLRLYFRLGIEEAYKFKYKNIPSKLYKYQPYEENRISTIINKKLWFTMPKDMNDPFDSRGVCWNTDEIEDFLKTRVPKDKIKEFGSIDSIVDGAIASLRNNIKITCFSEEIISMPMWSHYANNHKGFCIEYDFTRLSYENDLTKYLFPVGYESHRYDITNLFKMTFSEPYDHRVKLLYFLMNLKHSSWSYEKEWWIIKMRLPEEKEFTSGLEDCPLKPTAIYLGVNFDKNEVHSVKEKLKGLDIPIYALKVSNSRFFDMELEPVN
ncbi:DUF2971 domain-containing protein [Clostridium cochlearium]|uniref:DUF2971 domain-containing protein n=1 Tax=Clostridium cochlearium TaxID=1494 RepID=UPI00241F56BE|nr:DUF2971 domain-containing protein [Clostridium cochlearium]MBE6064971.1 DUF2971 domain-containing protein [Clostridium cochlearium]